MTLNIDGFNRMPKKQSVNKYQLTITSKTKVQQNLLSAAIHTNIYVSALKSGFKYGLIIPGFWVRIPEGPPGFSTGQATCLACSLIKDNNICPLSAGVPTFRRRPAVIRDAPATKPAHLLRFTPTPRPYPVFRENRRPSTCGFNLGHIGVVEG